MPMPEQLTPWYRVAEKMLADVVVDDGVDPAVTGSLMAGSSALPARLHYDEQDEAPSEAPVVPRVKLRQKSAKGLERLLVLELDEAFAAKSELRRVELSVDLREPGLTEKLAEKLSELVGED